MGVGVDEDVMAVLPEPAAGLAAIGPILDRSGRPELSGVIR
jgi:hypothetical protein